MKRVLLTGMSGTGKSTVIRELAARGYKAIDADDDGWSHWIDMRTLPSRKLSSAFSKSRNQRPEKK